MDNEAWEEWIANSKGPVPPEKRLMVAVLADAVDCFIRKPRQREKARKWISARNVKDHTGRPWLFSFESICQFLDCDPDTIMYGIYHRLEDKLYENMEGN